MAPAETTIDDPRSLRDPVVTYKFPRYPFGDQWYPVGTVLVPVELPIVTPELPSKHLLYSKIPEGTTITTLRYRNINTP